MGILYLSVFFDFTCMPPRYINNTIYGIIESFKYRKANLIFSLISILQGWPELSIGAQQLSLECLQACYMEAVGRHPLLL